MDKPICKIIAVLVFFAASVHTFAQTQRIILQVEPLTVRGASSQEGSALENLMFSYLSEKDLIIVKGKHKTANSSENPEVILPPDYIMNTSLSYNDNNYTFEIDISKLNHSEPVYKHISLHRSSSEIALSLRSIVDDAFKDKSSNIIGEIIPLQLSRDKILGLWKGDGGIELIRFLPDGKGFAFFSSGVNMMLSYNIGDNVLFVSQSSPNNERFYYPLPLPVAKRLAETADPMRWEFFLTENGQVLKGKRISTTAEFANYNNITIIKNNHTDSEWNKMPR
ncbi:MAG: hypothetical protein Ta2B_06110 [Termitinemataceae bacterium]|nr:MAG: hypothetical protein Ta2B_06110 [Termitinemataceae bacterium]